MPPLSLVARALAHSWIVGCLVNEQKSIWLGMQSNTGGLRVLAEVYTCVSQVDLKWSWIQTSCCMEFLVVMILIRFSWA